MYHKRDESMNTMPFIRTAQVEIIEKHKDGILPLTPALHEYLKTLCERGTGTLTEIPYKELALYFGCTLQAIHKSVRELVRTDWLYRPEHLNPRGCGVLTGRIIGPEFAHEIANLTVKRKASIDHAKKHKADVSIPAQLFDRRIEERETKFSDERSHLRQKRPAKTKGHYDHAVTVKLMFGEHADS